jgi:hypothetical protein
MSGDSWVTRKLNEMGSGKIYYEVFKLLDIF